MKKEVTKISSLHSKFSVETGICLINQKRRAYTLAEMLITLAIIGIVSALVIPTVIKNYNDKKYNTARLKALKTFGEAGKLASINGEINGQPSARAFVENVLSKYLKITKVCDTAAECGFPSEIQPSNPSADKLFSDDYKKWGQLGWNSSTARISSPYNDVNMSVYVATTDAFSAKLFYNPKCGKNSHDVNFWNECPYKECGHQNIDSACLNIVYDMNSIKGPNHVGEDMGIVTTFWSGLNATAVAPGLLPYKVNEVYITNNFFEASKHCISLSTNKEIYSVPTTDELSSIYMNMVFTSITRNYFWSSSPVIGRTGYYWFSESNGSRQHYPYGHRIGVWCVRR